VVLTAFCKYESAIKISILIANKIPVQIHHNTSYNAYELWHLLPVMSKCRPNSKERVECETKRKLPTWKTKIKMQATC